MLTTYGSKGPYPFAEREAHYATLTDAELLAARLAVRAHLKTVSNTDPNQGWYFDDVSTIAGEQARRERAPRCEACNGTGHAPRRR